MAASAAKNAVVELLIESTPTVFTEVKSTAFKIGGKTIDVSTLSSEWEKSLPGQRSWSGSLECHYDPADVAQEATLAALLAGTSVSIVYYPLGKIATKPKYSGTAWITGSDFSAKLGDAIVQTLDYTGTGELTKGVYSAG